VLSLRRGDLGDGEQDQRLTATVTATAAANGYQQRPATAHNTRTIRANWGYVRPEKQTVEDQRQTGAASVSVLVSFAKVRGRPRRTEPGRSFRSQTTLTCRERTSTDLESGLGDSGRENERPAD
jgi:hypothetical protein